MHRLTALAFALLVLLASVQPSVLARETNGDRLKRGYPPLPPTLRETAERQQSSPSVVTGVIQVRDNSGTTLLGFMGNVENTSGQPPDFDIIGVVDPSEPKSDRMRARWSSISDTLVAINLVFSPVPHLFEPPYYLNGGPTLFMISNSPADLLVTPNPGGVSWYYDFQTQELTGYIDKRGIGPQVFFIWDQTVNQLTVWPFSGFPGFQYVRLFLT